MLGHEVPFSYCREPGKDLLCRNIVDCWWELFDVQAFLKLHYEPAVIAQSISPPEPKMTSLLSLIERARGE